MRDDIGTIIHPVMSYALRLKERLDQGEQPVLDAEQATLKRLLLTTVDARRTADFGADEVGRGDAGRRPEQYLGIRFALTCWIDELFILTTPWREQWNERKLEVDLYGTNDRAWRFWEQAALAQGRQLSDGLEAAFLCVVLGFRGELRERPDQLRAWVKETKERLAKIRRKEWPYPLDLEPPTAVPPLTGRDHLQTMLVVSGVTVLLLIPVAAFFFVYSFRE